MSALRRARALAALSALLAAVGLAGCGDSDSGTPSAHEHHEATPSGSSAAQVDGDWLLRFTTAGGSDGEQVGAVYVTFDPATGSAASRRVPSLAATDAGPDDAPLLVSADHAWAIQDTGVPKGQARSGKLLLYSVTSEETRTLDIRSLTGQSGLRARGWAFDPVDAHVLRVVDADRAVWKVDLSAGSATREGTLPARDGWIFGNGFDKNTGEPYIESIDSDETEPPGNGDLDTGPVERQGGTLIRYDGGELEGLPSPPCGFAGGFESGDGISWLFCADTPQITAYQAAQGGASWHQYGTPSPDIVPSGAVELSFVLPPVS
jgi:hypothetical protein